MQIFQLAIHLIGFALTFQNCEAISLYRPSNNLQRRATKVLLSEAVINVDIKSFVISHLDLTSVAVDAAGTNYTNTLSYLFADPNSNTSTTCTNSWTDLKNSTANAPTSYVLCDNTTTTIDEHFQWRFESITDLCSFEIEFTHGFNDPADYPPPYSYVQYFSQNSLNLTCTENGDGTTCSLPQNQTSLTAPVTSISN